MVQFEESMCLETEELLAHDGDWLISRFRFQRAILLELCAELRQALELNAVANQLELCQSTLSRAMLAEWDGIICISARYIKFPYNAVEQANIKAQFAARDSFPNVIGAIDCTHIAIKAPSHDEFVYVNR